MKIVRQALVAAVLLPLLAVPARPAETKPMARVMVWDRPALNQTPKVYPAAECPAPGMRAFFFEGADYKGKPTKVFAYYADPEGQPPAGGWPAAVCVHGGGGTAFPEWVKMWNTFGYAAISMDLEGHLPNGQAHDQAGPARTNWFSDISFLDREQWFYHAVADVVRAQSLLRSFPEINPNKIGATGISWGGTIVSTVAGVDPRFAFVVPVYGCGYIHESDNEGIAQWFRPKNMTPAQFLDYRTKWDPSAHLPHAKMPMLWVNGSNDGTFPMDIFQRSALAMSGPHTLCIRLRMIHSHGPGWKPREIYAFADSVVRGEIPLPVVGRPELEAGTGRVRCQVKGQAAQATLCYTTGAGKWQPRPWESAPGAIKGNEVSAALPKGTTAAFFNVKDDRGWLVSSEYLEVK